MQWQYPVVLWVFIMRCKCSDWGKQACHCFLQDPNIQARPIYIIPCWCQTRFTIWYIPFFSRCFRTDIVILHHYIIIIKSEVSTFPIVVIFFRGCGSEMVVLSYSVIYYIYIPGTLGPCFHYWCSVYGICKWSDTLWPVGRVRLFADYTTSLSSLCRLIWKHWTTKMLVRYMMPSVCLRLRQFSQLSLYSLYGAVCLQLTQFSCDDRENVYFILLSSSNRKYESLTIV